MEIRQREDIKQQKKNLRKEKIILRKKLSEDMRITADLCIRQTLESLPEFQKAKNIFCFVSMSDEVDTWRLINDMLSMGKHVSVPLVTDAANGQQEAVRLRSLKELALGAFGIPTVRDGLRTIVPPEKLDFIVVPGSSFDEKGHRLGLGGGYYDRFMQRAVNAKRVAIAYQCQMSEWIPMEEFDECVDIVVTEEKCYNCCESDK